VIGLRGSAEREITGDLVDAFCALTGDVDPLHVDEEFARASPYGARIAPGSLVIALMMAAAVEATASAPTTRSSPSTAGAGMPT
jgi:acyl dehydratase